MKSYEELAKNITYEPTDGTFKWTTGNRGRKKGAIAGCTSSGYRMIQLGRYTYNAHTLAFFIMKNISLKWLTI